MARDLANLVGQALVGAVKAMFDLGKTIAEFAVATMSTTWDLARRLVDAAIKAGTAIGSILTTALQQGYLVFRRILKAVFSVTGPIGAALDWLLTQAEDVAELAWRTAVEMLESVGRSIGEALDWALAKGADVLKRVVATIEQVGMVVADVISWAVRAGDAALELIGEALVKAGHTVEGVLIWVERSGIPAIAAAVRGMLAAGATIVDLLAWATQRAVQVVVETVRAILASGAAIADLLLATIARPGDAFKNLVAALDQLGRTMTELLQAAIVQPTEDLYRKVVDSLRQLGKTALEVIVAAAEAGAAALALAFTLLLEWFPGEYRPLTATERADAQEVFGNSIPLDEVRLSVKSFAVDFIEWVNGGRAVTTMRLINFASWDTLSPDTLIHELTHVWQGVVDGPIYMVEALEAQLVGEGYNYGYDDSTTGEGGQDDLQAASGDLAHFNREQQAQIIMHYWHRKFVSAPPLETTEWQPYADVVHA